MRTCLRLWAVCAACVLRLQLAAQPADTLQLDTLRIGESALAAPWRMLPQMPVTGVSLSAADLSGLYYGQEPSLALAATPGITQYSDAGSYWGYSYFRIRGMDQTRVNITLDGVPLNEPEDQGMYFSNYPDFLNSVQSVQIQRGTGASPQGTAAYAGSIQLESPALFAPASRQLSLGYGSFNSRRIAGEWNTGVRRRTGLYVRASHLHSDGYKEHSTHDGNSLFISTGYFGARHIWKLTAFAGRQANALAWLGAPMDSIARNPRFNANSPEETDRFLQALVKLQHLTPAGKSATLSTTVYYTYLRGSYEFDLNNFLQESQPGERYTYAFRSDFAGLFSVYRWQSGPFHVDAGLHANAYRRTHTGSERSLGELYVNTGYKPEGSAFARARWETGPFQVFADLQVRAVQFGYRGPEVEDFEPLRWLFLNPRLGLNRRLRGSWMLYYSLGATGREPARNDLFAGSDFLPVDADGMPLLAVRDAESVLDQEIGLRRTRKTGDLALNLYLMRFQREIVLNGEFGPNGLPLRSDVAASIRSGLEAEYRFGFGPGGRFAAAGNLAWAFNRIRDGEQIFQPVLSPALIANQQLSCRLGPVTLALQGRYQGESFIDFANQHVLPAFFVWDGRAEWQHKRMRWALRGQNLGNARYFTNGQLDLYGAPAYHIQAPRNAWVSFDLTF
ncbi:MAG: TonB-dependent receptor plug domain-containing protein [Bacteroidia bacterium]|nr:TonB-dependent receptor plug domain-containing protein [Bacteroidia bacterium]